MCLYRYVGINSHKLTTAGDTIIVTLYVFTIMLFVMPSCLSIYFNDGENSKMKYKHRKQAHRDFRIVQ